MSTNGESIRPHCGNELVDLRVPRWGALMSACLCRNTCDRYAERARSGRS